MHNLIWDKSKRIKQNTRIDQGKYVSDDSLPIIKNLEANFTPWKQRGFRESYLYKDNLKAKYVLKISNLNIGAIDTCRIGKIEKPTNKS